MRIWYKEYWDNFLQKLFSFFISVKMIVITVTFAFMTFLYFRLEALLKSNLINQKEFAAAFDSLLKHPTLIIVTIIGARGAIQIGNVLMTKYKEIKDKK